MRLRVVPEATLPVREMPDYLLAQKLNQHLQAPRLLRDDARIRELAGELAYRLMPEAA